MLKSSIKTINDKFGSKRGLLNYVWFKLQTTFGHFAKYNEVDWARVERLVFVCHGNICRSSLAEGVAKSLGKNAISFGIDCSEGVGADPRAIAYASKIDVDLRHHQTQSLSSVDILPGDLIIVMEPNHIQHFDALLKTGVQLTLAGLWDSERCAYIHDPYNSSETFFSRCEKRVSEASHALASRWVRTE